MRFINKLKIFLHRFFLIDDSPHKVAAGAALGIFLGIVPGEGYLNTIFFAWLFRLNRLSALAGVASSNMWATIALLPVAASIGGLIFHKNTSDLVNNFYQNYSLGYTFFFNKFIIFDLLVPLTVGLVVVAAAIALPLYFILYYLLKHKKIKFQ